MLLLCKIDKQYKHNMIRYENIVMSQRRRPTLMQDCKIHEWIQINCLRELKNVESTEWKHGILKTFHRNGL